MAVVELRSDLNCAHRSMTNQVGLGEKTCWSKRMRPTAAWPVADPTPTAIQRAGPQPAVVGDNLAPQLLTPYHKQEGHKRGPFCSDPQGLLSPPPPLLSPPPVGVPRQSPPPVSVPRQMSNGFLEKATFSLAPPSSTHPPPTPA